MAQASDMVDRACTRASAGPELVVFVHGTGAGDDADRGDKWWQIGSAFERRFSEAVGADAIVDKPFHWEKGPNSESARRAAGEALLGRLYKLKGRNYHLVGHSHGGSIIWHALVASSRKGQRLSGLRSWATVGTPFLEFCPVKPPLSRWVAFLALWGALTLVMFRCPPVEWWPIVLHWNDGSLWSVAGVGLLFAALVLLAAWATLRVAAPFLLWLLSASTRRAEKEASEWYRGHWLALWHPLDEPINGLAATVGNASPIAPRASAGGLAGFIWLFEPLVNRFLARATDEFAWKQLAARLQGADVAGVRLVRVGRSPAALSPGFEPLSQPLADLLAASADAKSSDSARRLRVLLEGAYDRQGANIVLDKIMTVVSFQEIIHTSYFDHEAVARILSGFVRANGQGSRPVAGGGGRTCTGLAEDAPPLLRQPEALDVSMHDTWARPLRYLESVTALGLFMGPAVLLAVAATTSYENVIAPRTARYQIDQIEAALSEPARTSNFFQPMVGNVIVRLAMLGRLKDPVATLESLPGETTRQSAAGPLANWLAQQKKWSEVERLALSDRIVGAEVEPQGTVIRTHALIGAAAGLVSPPQALLDRVQRDAVRFATREGGQVPLVNYEDLGRAFGRLSAFDRVLQMVGGSIDAAGADAPAPGLLVRDKCPLVAGAVLGALEAKSAISRSDTLPVACNRYVDQVDFFYRKADLLLKQATPADLRSKIDRNTYDRYGYPALADNLGNVAFDVIFMRLEDRFQQAVFNISTRNSLELRVFNGEKIDQVVKDAASALNRPAGGKYLVALLVHEFAKPKTYSITASVARELSRVYATAFAQIAADPVSADQDFLLSGTNPNQPTRDRLISRLNIFAETAAMLELADRPTDAQQLLSDIHQHLMKTFLNDVAHPERSNRDTKTITGLVSVAEAAFRINSPEFARRALDDAMKAMGSAFLDIDGVTVFMRIADVARDRYDAVALAALAAAERTAARELKDDVRSQYLVAISRQWLARGDYVRARTTAERSSSPSAIMSVYHDILDRALVDRGSSIAYIPR